MEAGDGGPTSRMCGYKFHLIKRLIADLVRSIWLVVAPRAVINQSAASHGALLRCVAVQWNFKHRISEAILAWAMYLADTSVRHDNTAKKKNSLLSIRRSKFHNRDWFAQIDTSFCFVKSIISCFAKLVTWPISPKQASFSFQTKMTSLVSGICKSKLKKHRVPDLIIFPCSFTVNFVAVSEARFFRGLHFSLDETVYHYSWTLRECVHLRYWRFWREIILLQISLKGGFLPIIKHF